VLIIDLEPTRQLSSDDEAHDVVQLIQHEVNESEEEFKDRRSLGPLYKRNKFFSLNLNFAVNKL